MGDNNEWSALKSAGHIYAPSDIAYVTSAVLARITRQRQALSHALGMEWLDVSRVRAWHAIYYIPDLDEWRTATLVQWRGDSNFQVGVVRDVGDGGAAQLSFVAMTTLAAVVFCGLHMVPDPVDWRQEL